MARRLSAEERALWRRVVETVRPLEGAAAPEPQPIPPAAAAVAPTLPRPAPPPAPVWKGPGHSLDSTWDRRLSRGLVRPEVVVDLHGHSLAAAHELLDRKLEQAIAGGSRLLLLITGKAPKGGAHPVRRGAIRAAVGDWLAASRHAADIAAVRNAHPRHGGAGALYIVLRRRRERP